VSVAAGPSGVSVPSLGGKPLAAAEDALASAGLKWTIYHQNHSPAISPHQGIVLTQSPVSGSRVKKGATIRVTVYGTLLTNGPTVKLPNLVGMLEWRAVNAIADRGLRPVVLGLGTSGAMAQLWTIESQSPAPGTALAVGASSVVVRAQPQVIYVTSRVATSACASSESRGIHVVAAYMISSAQLRAPIFGGGTLSRQAPSSLWRMCYVTGPHVMEQTGPPGTPAWGPSNAIYIFYRNGMIAEALGKTDFQIEVVAH
jgi:hypothetical protein